MHPDLERLIALQRLDLDLQRHRRTVDTEAERRAAIEQAVETRRAALTHIKHRLAENQQARRAVEKDLAQIQTRLSRYKDQLMEVKTNKEYHAMQTEIATAEAEVRKLEDLVLENLVEADDITAQLDAAERETGEAAAEAQAAIQRLAQESAHAGQQLTVTGAARAELAASLPKPVLTMFENIASHRGAAVVEARDGHCTVCHVRLRPKVYQDVRRNDMIIQCDSCQRILFYVPPTAGQTSPAAGQ
jgi:predicted  nucleic acid-binding Zn-ribbon protein